MRRPTLPRRAPAAPTRSAPAGLLFEGAGAPVPEAELLLLDEVPVELLPVELEADALLLAVCWNEVKFLSAVGLMANTMPC